MKIFFVVFFVSFLLFSNRAQAGCTTQDIRNLKAANFTTEQIDEICPLCNAQDILQYAQQDKTREQIEQLCKGGKTRDSEASPAGVEKMPAYVLLLTKPLTFGFDTYHTDKVLKNQASDGGLKSDRSGSEIFNMYLKYTLPISSLTYAFDQNRPSAPHPLLKAFKLYLEGNYGNSINSDGSGSGITIKTKNEVYYKAGLRFESDMETLFSRGKKYQDYQNW